jgi:tetratricopeptide (TPR) repeat protein
MENECRNSSYPGRSVFALAVCILAAPVITDCGGGGPDKTAVSDMPTDPQELERGALELAEARDFKNAVEYMKDAQSKEPTLQRRLGVAHLLYMNGNHKQALEGYQAYLSVVAGIPARIAADLNAEIDRIEVAIKAGDEPVGRSLAGQWLRGSLASLQAKDSLDKGEYANAVVSFDKAYQYTGDAELLFEAALAATMAKDWPGAHEKYIDYLERGQKEVPAEKTYMVRSEIDRLTVVIAGQEPVTWDSLADQIYGERAGDRDPMDEPPSVNDVESEPEGDAGIEESDQIDPEMGEVSEVEDVKVDKVAAKKAAKEARQKELKAERERKKAEREAKVAAKKAAAAEKKRKKEAAEEPEESKIEEEPTSSGYKQVQGATASGKMPVHPPREVPSLQDLMFYAKSRSATVRLRAVKDLISVSDDRARQVLEERMVNDTNMQVRFTAIRGLSARRSHVSIPVIRKARITAGTSQERAVLKKAMDEIIESSR